MSTRCSPSRRGWDGEAPMLIHCWAGISRSMASAFTILCDRLGPGLRSGDRHGDAPARARTPSPTACWCATPTRRWAAAARMMAALDSMGPPLLLEEGVTTVFPLVGL